VIIGPVCGLVELTFCWKKYMFCALKSSQRYRIRASVWKLTKKTNTIKNVPSFLNNKKVPGLFTSVAICKAWKFNLHLTAYNGLYHCFKLLTNTI